MATRKRVLIVGGGFGGLTLAKQLASLPVDVTLVDRENHHLFQPLLYQVAMAGLSPAEIAVPIRSVLRRQRNTQVILGEAVAIHLERRELTLADGEVLPFDYLAIAAGAETNYFGHNDWARHSRGLKSIDDAIAVRQQVLLAFESAERELDAQAQKRLLTFVIIGGGATGVEVAGTLSELTRIVLACDFRRIDHKVPRIVLLEGGPRLLPPFDARLSANAEKELRGMGVEVRTSTLVTSIDERGVHIGEELIETECVVWAAGVKPRSIASALGVELDRQGRIVVTKDCSVPGHPNVFAFGDIAHFEGEDGRVLPGLAPVALQAGRSVAKNIARDLEGEPRKPFSYFDKGMMATIGRSRAVVEYGKARATGFIAWLMWIAVHIWFLIGFRNRVAVILQWFWLYLTFRRGARLITNLPESARRHRPAAILHAQAHREATHSYSTKTDSPGQSS